MNSRRAISLLLFGFLLLAATTAKEAQRPGAIPGTQQGREEMKRVQKTIDPALSPQMRLHWKEARADAEKLRALAQRIHEQVEAGAGKFPPGWPES